MKTSEQDSLMHKKIHEILNHYDRKSVAHKIDSFKVKSLKELGKEI
jgi:hypothetical protein